VKKKTAPTFKKTTSSSIVDTQEEFEESVLCSDYFVDSSVFGEIRRVESTAMSSSPENTTVSCLLVLLGLIVNAPWSQQNCIILVHNHRFIEEVFK